MSHAAVRIVANWLNDGTYGVNAIAAVVPLDTDDTVPPAVTVYDETRDGWVARNQVPRPTSKVAMPAVIVFLQQAQSPGGVVPSASGGRVANGTVQLAIQLLMDEAHTETAVTAGMYLMRAIRNSLMQLDEGENDAARTLVGVRLLPSKSLVQGQLDAPQSDGVLSLGAIVVQYDTEELTALTLPT